MLNLGWKKKVLHLKVTVQPTEKEVGFLEKAVEMMGGDPARHVIIGHRSNVSSDPGLLGFGWWTWKNIDALYEVQVHKDKKGKDAIRIVPSGSRAADGYEKIDLKNVEP